MKRITSLFSILLFMAILVVPSLIWGIKKIARSDAFEVQIEENREPAKWPTKFSSDFPMITHLGFASKLSTKMVTG